MTLKDVCFYSFIVILILRGAISWMVVIIVKGHSCCLEFTLNDKDNRYPDNRCHGLIFDDKDNCCTEFTFDDKDNYNIDFTYNGQDNCSHEFTFND